MPYRLVIIESEAASADANVLATLATEREYACHALDWSNATPESLTATDPHAVVAVARSPAPKVVDLLGWLRARCASIPTLAVLPKESEEPVLRVASASVDDFILSPVRALELRYRLQRMLGWRQEVGGREVALHELVGNDPTFVRAVQLLPRFARSGMPVLITGETGTGKELCARALHGLSERRDAPFIAVDCAAVPDQLFENEFFGHARGAFTDAHRAQRGLIAMAEGGTLFLDEVDGLSASAQGKLLRFLQERTYRPLGADRFEPANVNIVAATNRDLELRVQDRQFRSDLFFRLNVLRVHLPPLRDRRGDVAWLAWHFLDELRRRASPMHKYFSVSALRKLSQYSWPGNVRELRNAVQRAAVLAEDSTIFPCHLSIVDDAPTGAPGNANFRQARAAFEQAYVENLLQKHHGNITQAAVEAQKERRAFGRLVKKYNLPRAKPGEF
jgi:DNA-binding NtrC family response regulator